MKRPPIPFVFPALAAGLLSPGATAQHPIGTGAEPPIPIHTAAADPAGGAYGLWAAAASYKASFHGDMTFIPYLGEDYPQNLPLAWRTASVRLGGRELLEAGRPPQRWRSDYRYEYRHGAVTEAYDVRAEGLEQSFVLPERPAGGGDLVVTGLLATPLVATPREPVTGPVDFRDADGRVVVRYGAAIAFDAAGRRTAVGTGYRKGTILLVVPGAWLEGALYPVTIDPLLARHQVNALSGPASVDVARDETNGQLLVVFARAASAIDWDAFGFVVADDYSLTRQVYADATVSWSTPHVRVASSAGRKYCAVLERRFASGARAVRLHLRNGGDLAFRTNVTAISTPLGSHDWRPDVGGKLPGFLTSPDFAVVYQQERSGLLFRDTANSRIVARIVDSSGNPGPEVVLANSALHDHARPSLNQQGSSSLPRQPAHWMVTYQRYANGGSPGDWKLLGRLLHSNGAVEPRIWAASEQPGPPQHRLAPQVAGSGGRYLVIYTRSSLAQVPGKTGLSNGHEVFGQRVDWLPGANPQNHPERLQYPSNGNRRFQVGGCAFDHETRSHWAFTVHQLRSQGGNGTVSYRRTGFRGIPTEAGLVQTGLAPLQGLAGGITYDRDNDRFPLAWAVSASSSDAVFVNQLTYPRAFPIIRYGLSCSAAQIDWTGSQQIGDEFTGVRLTAAPPGALAFLLVGLARTNASLAALQMPGCTLLVPNTGPDYVGLGVTTTNSSGNASFGLPLPEFLHTDDLFFQWFHSAPGLNPANLATTRGLQVQVVR